MRRDPFQVLRSTPVLTTFTQTRLILVKVGTQICPIYLAPIHIITDSNTRCLSKVVKGPMDIEMQEGALCMHGSSKFRMLLHNGSSQLHRQSLRYNKPLSL